MNHHVIVHHAGCPDGVGSAAWLGRHLARTGRTPTSHVEHVYGSYGHPPTYEQIVADCTGKFVWFVDFCWSTEALIDLRNVARRVMVIDHHQTSLRWLEEAGFNIMNADDVFTVGDVPGYTGADAIHDQRRSGIGLTSGLVRWFFPSADPPSWFKYIEDRDLWKFDYGDDTRDACAALTSYPYTIEAWNALIDASSQPDHELLLLAEGAAINRFRNQLIESCVANARRNTVAGHHAIWATDAPYTIGSDVAGILAERDPERFAAYYVRSPGGTKVGLRSAANGADVAAIAERLGGGGHRHAAGYTIPRGVHASGNTPGGQLG